MNKKVFDPITKKMVKKKPIKQKAGGRVLKDGEDLEEQVVKAPGRFAKWREDRRKRKQEIRDAKHEAKLAKIRGPKSEPAKEPEKKTEYKSVTKLSPSEEKERRQAKGKQTRSLHKTFDVEPGRRRGIKHTVEENMTKLNEAGRIKAALKTIKDVAPYAGAAAALGAATFAPAGPKAMAAGAAGYMGVTGAMAAKEIRKTYRRFRAEEFEQIDEKTGKPKKYKYVSGFKPTNSGAGLKKGAVNLKSQAKTYSKWQALKNKDGKEAADKWLVNKGFNEDMINTFEELDQLNEDENPFEIARQNYDALIQGALSGNAVDVRNAVNDIMVTKATDVVAAIKDEVSQTMFGTEENPEDGRPKGDDEDDEWSPEDDEDDLDDEDDDTEHPELDDDDDESDDDFEDDDEVEGYDDEDDDLPDEDDDTEDEEDA